VRIHIGFGDYPGGFNTSVWRCLIPGEALTRAGHDVTFSHIADIGNWDADSYLLERNLYIPEVFSAIENLHSKGKRLVATFDDHYAIMPDTCLSKGTWNGNNLQRFIDALGIVDCAIVPNKLLAEDYSPFCKEIRYVPNYADMDLYRNIKNRSVAKEHPTVNVMWGGNSTHLQGLKETGFLEALGKLCEKRRLVKVITVADRMCALAFSRYIPAEQLVIENWKPLSEWTKFVAARADIIACPLYGEYDMRRSWVKAIDAVVFGIPLIASNLEPFRGTGAMMVQNTQKDWYNALGDLVSNQWRAHRVVESMVSALGSVSIDDHIKEYEEVLG